MTDGSCSRERYGEPFWRAHHEAWRQSDLNQREYCGNLEQYSLSAISALAERAVAALVPR